MGIGMTIIVNHIGGYVLTESSKFMDKRLPEDYSGLNIKGSGGIS